MGSRNSNLELLRVLSMIFVVLAHFIGWGTTHNGVGEIIVSFENGGINGWIFPFITPLSAMGVICFILISSYFICENNILRFDRIFKVWFQTVFYSVLLAFVSSRFIQVSGKDIIKSFFPIWSNEYWFVTKYIALVILAPIFSIIVNSVSKKGMSIILFALSFITVTITCNIPFGNSFFSDSPLSVASFVLLFFIAAYIKKFGTSKWIERNSGWLFIAGILIQGIGGIALNFIHDSSQVIYGGFSVGYNALSIVPGTALFIWFKNHKFSNSWLTRFLVFLAPYTFAVYLIHDNAYFRTILWNKIIDPALYWQSPVWIILMITVPIAILLICCAIDIFRKQLFKLLRVEIITEQIRQYNLIIETKNK